MDGRLLMARSPLRSHVLHVLLLRARSEMRRVAAETVVAGVHDNHARRNRSPGGHVRHPMGVMHDPPERSRSVAPNSHRTQPRPTRIWAAGLINAREHILRPVRLCHVVTGSGAELVRPTAWRSAERLPALMAHKLRFWPVFFQFLVQRNETAGVRAVLGGCGLVPLHLGRPPTDNTCDGRWHLALLRDRLFPLQILPYLDHTDRYRQGD